MSPARGVIRRAWARAIVLGVVALLAGACATAAPDQSAGASPASSRTARPPAAGPPRVEPLPDAFRSDDFIVTFARAGDTAETLAARHLGVRLEEGDLVAAFGASYEQYRRRVPMLLPRLFGGGSLASETRHGG